MDWHDIRQFYPSLLLQTIVASKSYFWDRYGRLMYLLCYLLHFRFENSYLTCEVIKTERINNCIYVYIVYFDWLFVHIILWCFKKESLVHFCEVNSVVRDFDKNDFTHKIVFAKHWMCTKIKVMLCH
jgi:hypothetical protein